MRKVPIVFFFNDIFKDMKNRNMYFEKAKKVNKISCPVNVWISR